MASDAGRVIPLPKGAWDASTNYETLDIVSYNNQSWMAKLNSIGITPVEGSFWTVYGSAVGKATTEALGVVKIPEDGTITIDEDGTIHAAPQIDVDDELSETSENPVQNKIITGALESLSETKADLATSGATIDFDEEHSLLYLKNKKGQLISQTHIEAGGVSSIIHIDTHEEDWKANEDVIVEIVDDTQTYQGHFDANGDYYHKVSTIGLHTVRVIDTDGQIYSSTVNVEVIGGVYYKFIDKTQPYMEWLVAGGLSKDAFGSLDEILADEVAVRRLMTIHASVDYMLDWIGKDADVYAKFLASTNALKWIGLRDYAYDHMPAEFIASWLGGDNWELALKDHVPTMTSDTTPYGVASASSVHESGEFPAWRAFNGVYESYSDTWTAHSKTTSGIVTYKFANPICIKRFLLKPRFETEAWIKDFRIEISDDGTNYTTIYSSTIGASEHIKEDVINNNAYCMYARINILNSNNANYIGIGILQFYGRSQADYSEREFAEGSTMKYLYDHGVELEPLSELNTSSGGVVSKDKQMFIQCLNGGVVELYTELIDITPYNLLRGIAGDKLVGDSVIEMLTGTVGGEGRLSYKVINTPLTNKNIDFDVSNINQNSRVMLWCGSQNLTMASLNELWLE